MTFMIFAEKLSTALMGKKKQTLSVLRKSLRFLFGVISQPRYGAGNRTRTCTLAQWNLNPPSLPIPPCPHTACGESDFITAGRICQRK